MATTADHDKRIKKELIDAGLPPVGQKSMAAKHLPKIVNEDENIQGAVYGWGANGISMLVATDRRVIYIERRPLYLSYDEVSYEVVSGVMYESAFFTSVILHTRIANYILKYVNRKSAETFVAAIEKRLGQLRIDVEKPTQTVAPKLPVLTTTRSVMTKEARQFLEQHELAVLSTSDRTGYVHGAVVNYVLGGQDDNSLYMITKTDTAKSKNMISNQQVAMTIYDADDLATVQLQGISRVENRPKVRVKVVQHIIRPRNYGGVEQLPPVTKLEAGNFIVFRILPTDVKYRTFKS